MRGLWLGAEALATSTRHQLAVVRAHPLFLVIGVLQPAVLLLVVYYARDRPTGSRAVSIGTAVLLMAYWGSTVWQGAAILRRERMAGTLAGFMRAVRSPMLVLTGKSLGASLGPAMLILVTVVAMLTLLGAELVVETPLWFAFGLAAAVLSGTALGTVLCSLFLLTRYGPQLSSALLYPTFLLAGLLIPPEFFPASIQWLGWLISLRWAQQFLTSAAAGTPDFTALGLVGLLTLVYAVAGVLAFRRIDHLARARGTLELG